MTSYAPAPHRQVTDYLEVPFYRPWLVVIPLVLCTLGALVASFVKPKMYRSSTLILVESDTVPDSFVPKITTSGPKERLYTIRQQILSRTRLGQIIHELNPYPEAAAKGTSETKLIEKMRDAITIQVRGTDAFLVEYVNRDPTTAMRVANRLASLFTEESTQSRTEQVEDAYDFIEKQLAEARSQLEANEEAVRVYKEKHLGVLPEQLAANLATLQRLQLEQQSLNDSIRAAESRIDLMQKAQADKARAADAGSPDPGAELDRLRDQLAQLRSRYSDLHPDVRALARRIAELEKAQEGGAASAAAPAAAQPGDSSALRQARSDLNILVEKRDEVDRKIATFQARVEQTPRTEQELALLTRDSTVLRENYLGLLNKKFDAERAEKLDRRWKGETFKTLDPAHFPERPFSPNRLLYVVVGFIFGLAMGVGLAFAADFLDHSLKDVTEVEATLSYPVLAIVSHVSKRKSGLFIPGPPAEEGQVRTG
jgi:polysaccharide chain length determinant protein (PEP-CTERM system associated)